MLLNTITQFVHLKVQEYAKQPAKYFFRTWLLLILPPIPFVTIYLLMFPEAAYVTDISTMYDKIIFTVIGPFIETVLLIFLLVIFSLFSLDRKWVIAINVVIWGLLHGVTAAYLFLPTAWAFYILIEAYLSGRKISFWRGFWLSAILHMFHNSFVACTIIFL